MKDKTDPEKRQVMFKKLPVRRKGMVEQRRRRMKKSRVLLSMKCKKQWNAHMLAGWYPHTGEIFFFLKKT